MSAPIAPVTDERSGDRWYPVPDGAGGWLRLLSVTTAFGAIAKIGLLKWATSLSAEAAFAELPTVITASRKKPCGNTGSRCAHDGPGTCDRCPCRVCRVCVSRWIADRHISESTRRAAEGSDTHGVIEWWTEHGEFRPYRPEIAPYVAAFEGFVAEYGLTPESFQVCEAVCVNRADAYAGTMDGIIRFDAAATPAAAKLVARVLRSRGEYPHIKTGKALVRAVIRDGRTADLVNDFKTREKPNPKFYPENALQVSGYRWAPQVRIKKTEIFEPMPETDGGLITQLRPDGVTARLVVCDETSYVAFLNALGLYLWLVERGSRAVGAHTFSLDLKTPSTETPGPEPVPAVDPAPFAFAAAAALSADTPC